MEESTSRRTFLRQLGGLGVYAITAGVLTAEGRIHAFYPEDEDSTSRIIWFKRNFQDQIERIVENTPFTPDLVTAVALHETGYLWASLLAKGLTKSEILELCVGDTFDFPKRNKDAFPKDKAELLAAKDGERMFRIAREALENIGKHNAAYQNVVEKYPDKFCHGFGIFQYDLQFYLKNPDFFLEKRWSDFDECLDLFVEDELTVALEKAGYKDRKDLNDTELVYVAIAYNRGKVEFEKGFQQGHQDPSTGKYYGEYIDEYIKLSKSVSIE